MFICVLCKYLSCDGLIKPSLSLHLALCARLDSTKARSLKLNLASIPGLSSSQPGQFTLLERAFPSILISLPFYVAINIYKEISHVYYKLYLILHLIKPDVDRALRRSPAQGSHSNPVATIRLICPLSLPAILGVHDVGCDGPTLQDFKKAFFTHIAQVLQTKKCVHSDKLIRCNTNLFPIQSPSQKLHNCKFVRLSLLERLSTSSLQ